MAHGGNGVGMLRGRVVVKVVVVNLTCDLRVLNYKLLDVHR